MLRIVGKIFMILDIIIILYNIWSILNVCVFKEIIEILVVKLVIIEVDFGINKNMIFRN